MKEKQRNKSTKAKRLLSLILAAVMAITQLPAAQAEAAEETLSNPQIVEDSSMESGQKVTWDYVWFGSYPQAEVVPSGVYTALPESLLQDGDIIVSDSIYNTLQSASGWDDNNEIILDGTKYRRIQKGDATSSMIGNTTICYYYWSDSTAYHYFRYEPIKWRVLHTDGNQALLLSDAVLDCQPYNTKGEDVTWETSTIRSWLNGYGAGSNQQSADYSQKNFIDSAFTASEQAVIINSQVENADNITWGTEGGNDTIDKIFLLSESEICNTDKAVSYGFVTDRNINDEARRSKSSTYAKAMGSYSKTDAKYTGNCSWGLRSPGYIESYAGGVDDGGQSSSYGYYVDSDNDGVRVALNLNLSSRGFVYPDDAWGFYNSDDVFGDTLNGYEIKVDDFSRLISHLTDTEMQAVVTSPSSKTDNMTGDIFFKSTLNVPVFPFHDEWGGSCYGMSNLACLIQQNIRSIEELGSSETLLKNVSFSGKVESAINFYQVQQQLPYIIEQVDDFMEKPSAEEQLKTLEELALNAQDGGTPFSIWYQWYKTDETGSKLIKNGDGNYDGYGHTVVGYGIEYSEKGFSVSCPIHSEEIYPKRILIYDCGAEKGEENYYDLYFDDEGNWYIPGRNAHSNSVEREGVLQNNAQLVLVASDEKILNAIDYKTGELSYDNSRNPEYMNISKNMRMFLSWEGGSCTIENCQVVSGEDIPILLGTGVSSEDSATQNASVILPDTSSSYTITSEEPISFTYYNGDYFEAVSSTGGGTVTVHKNGSVELDSKQETDYSIKVTANESPLPYSTMNVSGIVDGRVCAAVETDGIRITGDGIHDMSVTCSNRTDTLSIPTNISSEQNEIFIEQGENNQILANGKSVGADDDAKPSVGNNTGNVTPTKTVTKPTKTVTKPTKTTLVRVKRKGKKIKIFWKKNRTGTGYIIQYSTNKKFKKNVTRRVVKKKSVTSATYSGLKKKKTYYVRIRTYKTVSGKKYYSKWSKIKKSKKIK